MSAATVLRVISADQLPAARRSPLDSRTLSEASAILDDVREAGEPAVRAHAERLGDLAPGDPMYYEPRELAAARDRLPTEHRLLLERTARRIERFARAQRACLRDLALSIPGGQAGHTCVAVETVGCYAPGGRAPLPSSVLMTAVTARAAGVRHVWVASPRPADATLAAADIAGADGLLAVGGAQAIGALALGVGPVPACDMVVGPGNRWVTAAKHLVCDRVGIDMLAGPSELVVLADDSAPPALVAADLLAQAEHDTDAVPMLVTTCPPLADAVNRQIEIQLPALSSAPTAARALQNGFAVLAPGLDAAIAVCDRLAPEHLQIMTRSPGDVAARIRNCGGVFIGSAAAEVLGDYGAGPNHVLPTGGTARFRAGLSVFTFLRARTWLRIDDGPASAPLVRDAGALARLESLDAHARAAEARLGAQVRE